MPDHDYALSCDLYVMQRPRLFQNLSVVGQIFNRNKKPVTNRDWPKRSFSGLKAGSVAMCTQGVFCPNHRIEPFALIAPRPE
jgi:hypothetical protein